MSEDRRRHRRQPDTAAIRCTVIGGAGGRSVLLQEELEGTIVDISEHGVGLVLSRPLEPGTIIRFGNGHPRLKGGSRGVVMWSCETSPHCRAGIKLLQ